MIMLRVMVATVARNFNVVAPAETNDRSMEVKDSFVSVLFPLLKCYLIPYVRSSFRLQWNVNSASVHALNPTSDLRILFSEALLLPSLPSFRVFLRFADLQL